MPPSTEVTLEKLRDRIKDTGDNTFQVSVARKKQNSGYLTHKISTLTGATIEMVAAPETWLPALFGGGFFHLTVSHAADPSKSIGDPIQIQIEGEPRDASPVILDIIRASDWLGPRGLIWPTIKELEERKASLVQQALSPLGTDGNGSVPRTLVPDPKTQAAIDPRYEMAIRGLEESKLAVEAKRRELDDMMRKSELENQRREMDAKTAKLEAQLAALSTAPRGPGIIEILAAVTPIVAKMMDGQNELRREMVVAEAKAREESNKMFHLLLEKKDDSSPNLKIMATMAESIQAINAMSVDAMHRMRDEVFGPPENTAVTVFRELGKALVAYGGGKVPSFKAPTNPSAPAALPPGKVASAPKPKTVKTADPVGRLEAMIRAKIHPELVADALFAALPEPAMQEALRAANGNYVNVIMGRLGDWAAVPANMEYLTALGGVITTKGHELGLFKEEEEGEDEDAEQEEENYAPEGEESAEVTEGATA